jgi:2-(1,2-epoxy-1,2-dihydrophenyl)acetyl-CoA isomerase
MRVLADVVLAIHGCPVPVVAKVDGLCVGAGVGLALAADLTWCSDRARFSLIFAKRGLSLDFGTSWLLRQRIGVHRAKELAFTARMLSGTEMHELGVVNAAVPAADLDAAVDELVATIAGGPPIALAATKRELDQAANGSLAEALELEALAQSVNVGTEDLREALLAYMERRPPVFTGR